MFATEACIFSGLSPRDSHGVDQAMRCSMTGVLCLPSRTEENSIIFKTKRLAYGEALAFSVQQEHSSAPKLMELEEKGTMPAGLTLTFHDTYFQERHGLFLSKRRAGIGQDSLGGFRRGRVTERRGESIAPDRRARSTVYELHECNDGSLQQCFLLLSDMYLLVIYNVILVTPTTPIPPRFIYSNHRVLEFDVRNHL